MTKNKGLYAMNSKDIQISVLSAQDFQAHLTAYFQIAYSITSTKLLVLLYSCEECANPVHIKSVTYNVKVSYYCHVYN
jgi:hypothetical protein